MISGRSIMMPSLSLGKCGQSVSPIGFGAFKIGRDEGTKYRSSYQIPEERESTHILNEMLDLGITYIDSAPAYGLSEERIGKAISHRRDEFILSTKTGESFENGTSHFDFSLEGTRRSVYRSLKRMKTDVIDIVFVHSNGRDIHIQDRTDVVEALQELKALGLIRAIGFSGKTVSGAKRALDWADVIMVEYHLSNASHTEVMHEATRRGVGVVVKKGLASGTLPASEAIRFVLGNPDVSSLLIGGLNLNHMRTNLSIASKIMNNQSAA